jgi:hypothetical protein
MAVVNNHIFGEVDRQLQNNGERCDPLNDGEFEY